MRRWKPPAIAAPRAKPPTRVEFVDGLLERIADLANPARQSLYQNADTLRRIHNLARAARNALPSKNPG